MCYVLMYHISPAMRKLIATSQKQVDDLARKIEDANKAAITFKQVSGGWHGM